MARTIAVLLAMAMACGQPDLDLVSRAAARPRMNEHAGCWQMRKEVNGRSTSIRHLPSAVDLRLDTVPARPNESTWMWARLRGVEVRAGYWALARNPDGLVVVWGEDSKGIEVRLRAEDDELVGTAYTTRNRRIGWAWQSNRVSARRIYPGRCELLPEER